MIAIQTSFRSVGYVIAAVVFFGGAAFVFSQARRGRREVGSEIELAANRKPYYDDNELETKKLNLSLWASFGLLVVIALALPMYWLAEPGRQQGALEYFEKVKFEGEGAELYNGDAGPKCVSCHGPNGTGGQAKFVINDETGNFINQVNWSAPALNTVMWRFSEAEVLDILTYGRPGTPMPAWGVKGGGALTDQNLSSLIAYLWSIQVPVETMRAEVDKAIAAVDPGLLERDKAVRAQNVGVEDVTQYKRLGRSDELELGEILFNLHDVASGAYSCSRCHIPGASYGEPGQSVEKIGTSRYAPNLVGIEKDLTEKQHFDLIMKGSEYGKQYGANHQGSGRMPGFGINANETAVNAVGDPRQPSADNPAKGSHEGMYTPDQVWAVVTYERNLSVEMANQAGSPLSASAVTATGGK